MPEKTDEVSESLKLAQEANDAWSAIGPSMDCEQKMERLSIVIQASPHHVDARMMRAECFEKANDLEMAASDLLYDSAILIL